MTVVVDASVLVAATVDAGVEGVWAEHVIETSPLSAPHLVLVETANIFRRLELANQLSQLEATSAYQDLLRLDINLLPFEPFSERIWALRNNLTSYDAWYVAAAETLDVPLATLDRRLIRASGPTCRFLVPD